MRARCRVLMQHGDGGRRAFDIPRVPADTDAYMGQLRAANPDAALIMVTEAGVVKARWSAHMGA